MKENIEIGSLWFCGNDKSKAIVWEVVDVKNGFVIHKYHHTIYNSIDEKNKYGSFDLQSVNEQAWLDLCKPYYDKIELCIQKIERSLKNE